MLVSQWKQSFQVMFYNNKCRSGFIFDFLILWKVSFIIFGAKPIDDSAINAMRDLLIKLWVRATICCGPALLSFNIKSIYKRLT